MLKTYEYRLYPTKEQEVLLNKHFGCVRLVYNKALELKKQLYKENKTSISCFELMKELTKWKQTEEFSFLYEVSNPALQQAIRHLDTAYRGFYTILKKNNGKVKYKKKSTKRKEREPEYIFTEKDIEGFPRFKSKRDSRQSYSLPERCFIDFENSKVKIPKFKGGIKARIDRTFEGIIRTCTVKKTSNGKYFISVLVEDGLELPSKPIIEKEKTIGIDLGIKSFATISNGNIIENPHFLRQDLKRLKVLQRRASKKQLGSNNRKKANLLVAKQHEKVANKRKDFLHKLTYTLTHDNQVSTICIEDLNVQGMMANHNKAQAIADVSWHEFVRQLTYKCEWYGVNLIKIGRFEPSSQLCSICGYQNKEVKDLTIREWICPICGAVHDRDLNASINIKNIGLDKNVNLCYNITIENLTRLGEPEELVELSSVEETVKQEQSILK